ncbi:MAG: ABC transporter permease [Pikeienuella sp.]
MLLQRSRAITAMVLREMSSRYGRSAGGYIWAIVEPVAFIAIFSVIFSQISQEPPLGRVFPLFFATGVITFGIYRDVATMTSGAFAFNKPLFTYPHITILDAVLARFILQFLTQVVVGTIVFSGLFIFFDIVPNIHLVPILLAMLIASAIGLGLGTMNAILFVLSPTWQRFWGVVSRPLFLISGIFFTPEMLPPAIREIILINPLVHVIGLMRTGFYPTYAADYINWPLILGLPSVTLVAGLLLMRKYQGQLIET